MMQPIRLYFAGNYRTEYDVEGVENRLMSYVYKNDTVKWKGFLEMYKDIHKNPHIILDSGAFTVWTRGKTIDVDKYIDFAIQYGEELKPYGVTYRVVSLDVIPGQVGNTAYLLRSGSNVFNESAEKGYENLKRFIKRGITPIHVFHQGEDFTWLDRIAELTDYIGVSPANDLGGIQKFEWMYDVFSYLHNRGIDVKTHGFGVTGPVPLIELPFTSVDSASWIIGAAMGNIFYPQGGLQNPNFLNVAILRIGNLTEKEWSSVMYDNIKEDMLSYGGDISYDKLYHTSFRAKYNAQYMLKLERWANEIRKTKQFKPRQTLGLV